MEQIFKSYCTLCRSRCGCLNHVDNGRFIKVTPDPDHPTGGALCAKGRSAPEHVYSPLRLASPLRRTNPRDADDPGWAEISWEEALREIADKLILIRSQQGAEAVAFSVTTPSGTPMIDSFEWVERFIRCYGSPNLIYAVEVCGWHKDYAHKLTFGRGIGVPDIENAETVILWGHNPARTWLAQASRIAAAHQKGAKLIVVDPKVDGSGQQADLWMNIRPGADAALALGAVRHLLTTEQYDHEFVARWTNASYLVDTRTGKLLRGKDCGITPEDAFISQSARSGDIDTVKDDSSVNLWAIGSFIDASGAQRHYKSVLALLKESVAQYTTRHVSDLT